MVEVALAAALDGGNNAIGHACQSILDATKKVALTLAENAEILAPVCLAIAGLAAGANMESATLAEVVVKPLVGFLAGGTAGTAVGKPVAKWAERIDRESSSERSFDR